jgi:hypothetical protein
MPFPKEATHAPTDGGYTYNPPFPSQITSLSSPLGIPAVKLERGKIWREFSDNGHLYACRFLYNPSTLQVSHGISSDQAFTPLPKSARDPNDPSTYNIPLGSTASFSLLFDRTYDLMLKKAAGTSAGNQGVERDIQALYYIVGIKGLKGGDNRLITSPMINNTVFVLFGGPDSLKFYGYISSLAITYTHWTQFMVPVRATAAITLTIFTYSPGAKAGISTDTTSHPQAGG